MVFSAATRVFGVASTMPLPERVVLQPGVGLAGGGQQRLARE